MNLLDLIFPKYCVNCKKYGDYLCANCFSRLSFETKNICLVCTKPSYNGLTHPSCAGKYRIDGSFTGIVYNSISKKLIYQFKYKPYLRNLSSFLGELLNESLIQDEEFNKILHYGRDDILLAPIPLSKQKMRKRGYNQAEILAKELAQKFDIKSISGLVRIRDTRSQVGLNKKDRMENVKDAFKFNEKYLPDFKKSRVILVDDVLTTGSTFSEAASVLKHRDVREVWAVALAKED